MTSDVNLDPLLHGLFGSSSMHLCNDLVLWVKGLFDLCTRGVMFC